jgi:hypothetical protein
MIYGGLGRIKIEGAILPSCRRNGSMRCRALMATLARKGLLDGP